MSYTCVYADTTANTLRAAIGSQVLFLSIFPKTNHAQTHIASIPAQKT